MNKKVLMLTPSFFLVSFFIPFTQTQKLTAHRVSPK